MRARNIKPSIFTNEILGTADPLLTILFEGLWCLADRDGRLEDRPLRIKAEVFPYRDGLEINRYLTDLERLQFIQRYVVDEVGYIQVINFTKHQTPHHTEKAKGYPALPRASNGNTNENARLSHDRDVTVIDHTNNRSLSVAERSDSLIPDSLIPITLSAESGAGERKNDSAPTIEKKSRFEEFWKIYPLKQARPPCEAKWKSKKLDNVADRIIANVIARLASDRRWSDGFIPNPLTYLNQERWNDPIPDRKPSTNGHSHPSITDDFKGKSYVGTPIDELPAELREPNLAA